MSKITFIVIFLFLTGPIVCQNKSKVNIFLDENLNSINKEDFNKKLNSFIYYSNIYKTDTITIYRIRESIKFGHLSKVENSQIRKLLNRDNETEDAFEGYLVLTFRDTLYGYDDYLKRFNSFSTQKSTFSEKLRVYDRNQKKCIRQDAKNNRERLYLFNYNKGYTYQPVNFEWKRSSSVLNKFLFNNQSSMIILKPNGEYFFFIEVYEKLIKELLDSEDWSDFVKDYEEAKTTLSGEPSGKLESIYMPKHLRSSGSVNNSSHCYYKGDY